MATIKDVAKMAGVSIGTVSNYLNQNRPVSKEASLKIQQAVDALQYSLNQSAKSLRSNSYTDIGIILPHFDDSYYVQMFQGMESILQNSGYYANLAFSYDIPETEQAILHSFMKKQIQGLILVPSQPDNWKYYYDHFVSTHRPLVLIDRDIKNLDANFVTFDNFSLIRRITTELLEKGYRKIYFFSGSEKFECESNCARGFREAYRAKGLEPESDHWISTNMTKEDAFRHLLRLIRGTVPEAIVVTSESIACGVVEGLRCLGYTQEDIPVVTLTEEHWNRHTHSFASATGSLPAIQLGKTVATMLLNQLNAPLTKENERVVITPTSDYSSSSFKSVIQPCRPLKEHVPEKTLRILMMDTPQVHALQGLLKNFERQENINAQVTVIPHHQLYKEIVDNHSSGTDAPYDVVMYDIPWLSSLAAGGFLADITQALDSIDPDIFLPDCYKYFSDFGHRYYGLPFMYAPQILYYRKDLFENPELKMAYFKQTGISLRPPLSLKEYNTIADFFTNSTDAVDYGIAIPAAYDECLAPEIYMRMLTYGGKLFDYKGNVCLDQDATLKAYINLLRSVRVAKPNYRQCTDTSIVRDFLGGETAMLINYPSFLADAVDLRRSSQIGAIGYHHVPGYNSVLGGWSLGISSRSTQQKEAFSFLRWLCDEQISTYFALLGAQTAITSTYTNDELVKLNPWLPLYHASYRHCKLMVPQNLGNHAVLSHTDIDRSVCKWVYQMLDGEADVSTAIRQTQAELETLVAHAKKTRQLYTKP